MTERDCNRNTSPARSRRADARRSATIVMAERSPKTLAAIDADIASRAAMRSNGLQLQAADGHRRRQRTVRLPLMAAKCMSLCDGARAGASSPGLQ